MASTYSDLKIELIGTGDQSGTWGVTTNTNLGTAIEEAITGSADVSFSSADVTLTASDSNATQSFRNLRLNLTGTSGGVRNLIVPAIEKFYIINNGLADTVTVKNSGGTGVAVPAGKTTLVFNDGTNVVNVITDLASLSVTSADINGGTIDSTVIGGGTAAAGTFTNLTSSGNLTAANLSASGTVSGVGFSNYLASPPAIGGTAAAAGTFTTGTFTGITISGGTLTTPATLTFSSTASVRLPNGTTAERPGSPLGGMIRYNSDTDKFEGYTTTWGSIGGGATGGGSDEVFQENELIVTTSYTLSTGKSAMSVGPITVNSGVTVTIPSGQRWVILQEYIMSITLNADTSSGLVMTSDTSGEIKLQSAGADIATVDSSGITMASGKSVSGGEIIQNGGPAFRASINSDLGVSVSTWTKVPFDTEEFDTNSNYDNATNYRFTPTVAGYYQANASVRVNYSGAAGDFVWVRIYKNGTAYNGHYNRDANGQPYGSVNVSDLVYMNGSSDYIEVYFQTNHNTATISNGIESKFSASLVRLA